MNKIEFVIVIVITFIVSMVWVISGLIGTKASVPVDPKILSIIEPLDPNFDQTAIEIVKNRLNTSINSPINPDQTPPPLPALPSIPNFIASPSGGINP